MFFFPNHYVCLIGSTNIVPMPLNRRCVFSWNWQTQWDRNDGSIRTNAVENEKARGRDFGHLTVGLAHEYDLKFGWFAFMIIFQERVLVGSQLSNGKRSHPHTISSYAQVCEIRSGQIYQWSAFVEPSEPYDLDLDWAQYIQYISSVKTKVTKSKVLNKLLSSYLVGHIRGFCHLLNIRMPWLPLVATGNR